MESKTLTARTIEILIEDGRLQERERLNRASVKEALEELILSCGGMIIDCKVDDALDAIFGSTVEIETLLKGQTHEKEK